MNIRINDDWRISADGSYNLTLEHRKVTGEGDRGRKPKKSGEEYWVAEGYYGRMEHLLRGFVDKMLIASDAGGFGEMVSELKVLHDTIVDVGGRLDKWWDEDHKRVLMPPLPDGVQKSKQRARKAKTNA